MKLKTCNPFKRWFTLLTVAFGGLLGETEGLAQTADDPKATGTVQGRVFNPVSKEYVRDAEVKLEGTNRVAYTEGDGSFQFPGVAAGEAVITVSYVGYTTAKETFTVAAGKTAVREITLSSTAPPLKTTADGKLMLEAFNVSTEREGNSKAIMAQRRNMDISTSVSSDIFGDVTDGNVGEFLKYLPGVDLDYVESEARGPRLGGMDSQYVGVSFDGIRTASADANRGGGEASRATSFEGFSITSIESIEISRTTSADSDADSPGGSINMKTKRAFDRKGRHYSFNASMNFNAEEFTLRKTPGPDDRRSYKWKPNLTLEYSESFFKQRFGLLLSASRANSYTEQYQIAMGYNRSPTTADPRPMVIRQIDFKDGPKFILKDALMLTADWKATPRLVLSTNAIYTYTEGEFWNRNFTWVAANDNANTNNGRSRVTGDGILTVGTARTANNTVPTLTNGGGSSSKLTYTRTLAQKFEYRYGSWLVDGSVSYSQSKNNYESLERGFSSSEGGSAPGDWVATRPTPGSWEWSIRQTSGADWYNLRSFTSTDARAGGTRVNNTDRTWITEIWAAQANVTWTLPFFKKFPTKLKFGGKWNEETRDNNNYDDWSIWSYVGPGGNTTAINNTTRVPANTAFGSWANLGFVSSHPFDLGTTNGLTVYNIAGVKGMPPRVDRNAVGDLFNAHPELFVRTATPENYYTSFIANRRDLNQTIAAGYVQADVRLSAKLQLRAGLRVEQTHNDVTQYDPLLRSEVLAAGYTVNAANTNGGRALTIQGLQYQYMSNPRVTRESESVRPFPSATLKYNIVPNLEFQLGGNLSLSRPPVDSLTGLWVVDEANLRITAPNPNLPSERHINVQSRLAYYFRGRAPGQLSISVSENKVTNLRETADFSASEFGVDDPEFAAYTFRTTQISDEERWFRNMDISYVQTLGFLPEKLRGTSINVTYGRSYASQRRNGLAPHRLTSRLGYAYRRFNGSLGMVWSDDKPDGNYGLYKGAITQFDLSLTWRFANRYSAYVQGRNISNVPVVWYASPTNSVEGKNAALRTMQEYGANWVFGVRGTF